MKTDFEQASSSSRLSKLQPNAGERKRRKRRGIGQGSGSGKTCGKGQKGQNSRAGSRLPRGFEGGQMPIHRRLPKVGFTSRKRVAGENVFKIIHLSTLTNLAVNGAVTIALLREKGLLRASTSKVKILAEGKDFGTKLLVEAHAFSAAAKKAIESAGGEAREIS